MRVKAKSSLPRTRSMWVLDNLSLLEQLTRPHLPMRTARCSMRRSAPGSRTRTVPGVRRSGECVGQRRESAVRRHGDFLRPAIVRRENAGLVDVQRRRGDTARFFALHLKKDAKPEAPSERYHPTEDRTRAYARLTGITAGMNVFQWDLRYPDATEITGFEPSGSGGGLDDSLLGPQIVPETTPSRSSTATRRCRSRSISHSIRAVPQPHGIWQRDGISA